MSKINKIKTVVIMLLASVLMFTASAFVVNAGRPQMVNAEGEKVFVMSDTIEARMSIPAGLRFRTYLNETVKAEVDSADEFGMIIAPSINFEKATSTDYLAEGAMVDKVVVSLNARKLTLLEDTTDSYYVASENRYFINAVLYNIQEKNWYLDFSAIAYYKINNVITYCTNATLPQANIGEIVEAEFFNAEGNTETRNELLENFNYGGTEEKVVNDTHVEEYTMPAHAIPVNNSNIVFVLTLPENAYSFKLTENVVVSNQNITAGDNIVSAWDITLVSTFNGILDGQGYNLVMNIHTNNRPTRGVFTTLNGTLKNLNVIVRADTWSSGNTEYGSFIYTLNGSIENCVITVHPTRYGNTSWTLNWAMIDNTGAEAVIKNSVFDNRQDMTTKFVRTQSETATIENVAIVEKDAWAEAEITTIPTVGNINGLYLFATTANLVTGTVAYKFDGTGFVASTDLINVKKTFGLDIAITDVTVRAGDGAQVDGVFSDSEATLSVPVFVVNEDSFATVVTTAQEFYDALKANKRIKLGADIVINNKNSSATDKLSAVEAAIGGTDFTYASTINGAGHTLTINIGSTSRPVRGVLLDNLTGTIKNINIVIETNNWGSGNEEHPTVIRNMNGTIENSTITLDAQRWGSSWNLVWSVFENTNADAVIKNTVIYNVAGVTNKFIRTQDTYTTIENVAIVEGGDGAWAEAEIATVSTAANISGLYLFNSLNDLVAGAPAYAYDGSAIVATTETIDVKETFGYELSLVEANVLYVAYNDGAYGADEVKTIVVPTTFSAEVAKTIKITLSAETLALNEKSEATTLTATVTKGGETITPTIAWASSDEGVVTVANGVVTVVGLGSARVTATYYGITATCEVTVSEYWYEVATGTDFVSIVNANPNAKIRLTADIIIYNKAVEGGDSTVGAYIAGEYNGIIDGQGHTVDIVMLECGRPSYTLFSTLNGTIKNVTFNVNRYDWGDATNRYPSFITNVNGTLEDTIINFYWNRFGTSWKILPNFFSTTGADAVIRNVVLHDVVPAFSEFILTPDAGTTIENVAIITGSLTDTHAAYVTGTDNTSNVYLFNSAANAAAGSYTYRYDASTKAMVAESGNTNLSKLFGYSIAVEATTFYAGCDDTSTTSGYNYTETSLNGIVFGNAATYTTVETGADFVSAITANTNANIQLGADIVLNNKYIENSTFTFDAQVLATFNGIIDGQGHTIILNINTTGRNSGMLFGTLNGTLKNANIVIRSNGWGPGVRVYLGTLVGTLNGTIENCVVNTYHTRFGTDYYLVYAPIGTLGASALVKDTVFNMASDTAVYLAHTVEATATLENVALVTNTAWTETSIATIITTCDINGLYLFDSVDGLVAGTVSYKFDGSAIVASTDAVDFGVVKSTATVRAGNYATDPDTGAAVYTDTEQVIDIVDFAD